MLTCHLPLKVKSKTECPFLMYRLFVKIKHLPSTYKPGTVYTLAYKCLRICSSWAKLHNELLCLKEFFLKKMATLKIL